MKKVSCALEDDIKDLINWLSKDHAIPEYVDIRIIEESGELLKAGEKRKINTDQLFTISEYSKKYDILKHKGLSWINLQCAGIYNNLLICVVEYPKSPVGSTKTSVNYSGPFTNTETFELEWDITKQYLIE